MSKQCPHCGFSLPKVADPFCSNCGEEIEQSQSDSGDMWTPPIPRRKLTATAKLVVLIYGGFAIAGAFAFILYLFPKLPAGRYPLFMFLAPFVVCGFVFGAITLYGMKKSGVKIFED